MNLPIDVHVIFQPHWDVSLRDECLSSIPANVNVHLINDNDRKNVIENRVAGFMTGNAEWVSYIDYDDTIIEGAFDKLHHHAASNGYDAVFGNSIIEHGATNKDIMFVKPQPNKMLLSGYTGVHQLYIVKRDLMEYLF